MNPDRIRLGISGLPLGNRSGTGYYTEQLLRVLSELGRARFDVSVLSVGKVEPEGALPSGRTSSPLSLRWPFQLFADRLLDKDLKELEIYVEETFQGAPQIVREKQKSNAKALQYDGYRGRRQ